VVHYNLLPDKGWECDLDHMESILASHNRGGSGIASSNNHNVVRGVLINNPSNPTGAVYSEDHLRQIIKLAEKYRVPIIADEIYGDMTFGRGGKIFHPMANVAAMMRYSVPIITASGLGKQCKFHRTSCHSPYF
jgi:tyrosine aminotransferase